MPQALDDTCSFGPEPGSVREVTLFFPELFHSSRGSFYNKSIIIDAEVTQICKRGALLGSGHSGSGGGKFSDI